MTNQSEVDAIYTIPVPLTTELTRLTFRCTGHDVALSGKVVLHTRTDEPGARYLDWDEFRCPSDPNELACYQTWVMIAADES